MLRLERLIVVPLVAFAVLTYGGKGWGAGGGPVKLGLSEFFLKDLGQQAIEKTFERAATAAGFKTVVTDANGSAAKQLTDVEDLISAGVKAVVINPVDSAAVVPAIERANAEKVPVFTVDRAPTGGKVALTVRADNKELGRLAGEEMVRLLKGKFGSPKGTVLEVTGDLATTNALDREAGFDKVIKQYSGIRLTVKEAKGWDPAKGADIVRTIVSTASVDGVYFHSEYTGAGIIPALDQLSQTPVGNPKHIFVVGIDGTPDGLKWIREGKLDATVSQPLSDFGSVVIKYGVIPILGGKTLHSGSVTQSGAIWSPASLNASAQPGPVILLAPTLVAKPNVNDQRLWGNQVH